MAIRTITVNGTTYRVDYDGLDGKPAIPTKTSDLENDSGFITSVPTATDSAAGILRPDGTTIVIENGVISLGIADANGVSY